MHGDGKDELKRTEQIEIQGQKFHINEMPSDHSCTFWAVATQSISSSVTVDDVQNLRQQCDACILENIETYAIFFGDDGDNYTDFNAHCSDMRDKNTWAGEHKIQAMSNMFNRPVYVYYEDNLNRSPQIHNEEYLNEAQPMYLFYVGNNHYDALVSISAHEKTDSEIKKAEQPVLDHQLLTKCPIVSTNVNEPMNEQKMLTYFVP